MPKLFAGKKVLVWTPFSGSSGWQKRNLGAFRAPPRGARETGPIRQRPTLPNRTQQCGRIGEPENDFLSVTGPQWGVSFARKIPRFPQATLQRSSRFRGRSGLPLDEPIRVFLKPLSIHNPCPELATLHKHGPPSIMPFGWVGSPSRTTKCGTPREGTTDKLGQCA